MLDAYHSKSKSVYANLSLVMRRNQVHNGVLLKLIFYDFTFGGYLEIQGNCFTDRLVEFPVFFLKLTTDTVDIVSALSDRWRYENKTFSIGSL